MSITDGWREWAKSFIDAKARREAMQLEYEAHIFLRMGFTTDELTLVSYEDGTKQVQPRQEGLRE